MINTAITGDFTLVPGSLIMVDSICELATDGVATIILNEIKTHKMKNLFTQHEIILVTTAGYYQRQLIGLSNDPAGELKKAYWNGHVHDLLARIVERDACHDPLTLRHTRTTTKILKMEFGSNAAALEKHKSIDSAFFMGTVNKN